MKPFKALKAVYSYMFPEVKKIIYETFLPKYGVDPYKSFNDNFISKITAIPEEMDTMHIPIINKWVNQHAGTLAGIHNFSYKYPTAGSEEGIREFMTYLLSIGVEKFYVLKGEYEGYKEVGKTREYSLEYSKGFMTQNKINKHIECIEVDENMIDSLEHGWFFISNPSARDGNVISNELIEKICNRHNVFLDLAYIDSIDNTYRSFNLNHPNIKAVVFSFSKPYGLFYFRFGGLLSKIEIPGLYGNKWFKVVPTLLIADNIMNTIDPDNLNIKYKYIQMAIIQELRKEYDIPFRASDVVILSYITADDAKNLTLDQLNIISQFKRADGYRFCLKPYFEDFENNLL